jgi:hypothetical protein
MNSCIGIPWSAGNTEVTGRLKCLFQRVLVTSIGMLDLLRLYYWFNLLIVYACWPKKHPHA